MPNLDIDALVPHRRPLRLIDEIVTVSQESAETAAVVSKDWPTVTAGAAHVLVLIELVAQTAAVIGGYQALMNPDGARPHKGMLVGIKQAVFTAETLPVGTRIVTRASTRPLMENFKQIDGVALIDDRVVGEMALQGVQME
jgi:predicted hotdog family 3-hydroxylacyl-ACP dehydratase